MVGYDEAAEKEEFGSYLSLDRHCTADTVRTYQAGRQLFRRWLAGREPETTSPRPFIADQLARLSADTASNRLYAVRRFYDFLGVTPNPTQGIHIKRSQTPPLPVVPLAEQRRLLYRTRTPRDEAMVLVLIETGVRIGELAGMQVEDIRWEDGSIRIEGKGRKVRDVWLSAEPLALLRGVVGSRTHGPVWLTKDGDPMTRERARKNFDRLAKAAAVSVHAHQLRATFANAWLKKGGDLGALKVAMGHSNVAQTLHYAGDSERERARDTARSLGLAGLVLGTNVVDFTAAKAARDV